MCRSSTPTCRVWDASTTGCPSPCPPWTCSALESRCSTKPKRNSTSSSSSTTSAAGECRYLWERFKVSNSSISGLLLLLLFLLLLRLNTRSWGCGIYWEFCRNFLLFPCKNTCRTPVIFFFFFFLACVCLYVCVFTHENKSAFSK